MINNSPPAFPDVSIGEGLQQDGGDADDDVLTLDVSNEEMHDLFRKREDVPAPRVVSSLSHGLPTINVTAATHQQPEMGENDFINNFNNIGLFTLTMKLHALTIMPILYHTVYIPLYAI